MKKIDGETPVAGRDLMERLVMLRYDALSRNVRTNLEAIGSHFCSAGAVTHPGEGIYCGTLLSRERRTNNIYGNCEPGNYSSSSGSVPIQIRSINLNATYKTLRTICYQGM